LERRLNQHNRFFKTRGGFWLHASLFRAAVRRVKTETDPTRIAQWAMIALAGYEFVKSGMGIREAIQGLIEAQAPNPAVDRFLNMGLSGSTPEVVN